MPLDFLEFKVKSVRTFVNKFNSEDENGGGDLDHCYPTWDHIKIENHINIEIIFEISKWMLNIVKIV